MKKDVVQFSCRTVKLLVWVIRFLMYIFFYLYIVGLYFIKGNIIALEILRGNEWKDDVERFNLGVEDAQKRLSDILDKAGFPTVRRSV